VASLRRVSAQDLWRVLRSSDPEDAARAVCPTWHARAYAALRAHLAAPDQAPGPVQAQAVAAAAPAAPRQTSAAAGGHAGIGTAAGSQSPVSGGARGSAARGAGALARGRTALRLLHALLARRPRPALRHTAHVLQARLSGPINDAAHMDALLLRALAEVVVMGLLWACAVQRGRSYRVPHQVPSIT